MQKEKRIPDKPRFQFVTETAYNFLLEYGYDRFPISSFKVLEDLSDFVICLSWSKAKSMFNIEDPFHLRRNDAEARTIRSLDDNGMYYIVYDDVKVTYKERISWTIMHEIGHIILRHLVDFKQTSLERGGLTEKDYKTLEIEADYFAAEVFMPTSILKHLQKITIDDISLIFGVSWEAAEKKYRRVFETDYLPETSYDDKLIRDFYNFFNHDIEAVLYERVRDKWGIFCETKFASICRKCPICYTYILDREAKYCYHCGSEIEVMETYCSL